MNCPKGKRGCSGVPCPPATDRLMNPPTAKAVPPPLGKEGFAGPYNAVPRLQTVTTDNQRRGLLFFKTN